jgi:peptidoglycan hydrolase CwlO-like protein
MPRVRRFFTALLFLAILFTSSLYAAPEEPADARTIAQVENDIKECKALIESLQNEQKKISGEISKISGESKVTNDMLNTYIKESTASTPRLTLPMRRLRLTLEDCRP